MSARTAVAAPDVGEARRHPCEVQTTCQPPSSWSKDPWPAVIRGISTGGVSLRLARRFERGSGLAIELPTEDGGTTTVLARISQVEAGEGGWLLGCTFISELSDDEVGLVLKLDPFHQPSLEVLDVPHGSRSPSVSGVLFQTRAAGEVLRWFVKRLDLSGPWPPSEGRAVSFRLAGPDGGPVVVGLVIKKCRLAGSYWIIDCTFRDDPGDAALHRLTAPAGG